VDVSGLQVVQHGGLVEVGQVGHVLALFELGRVDLLHLRSILGISTTVTDGQNLLGWVEVGILGLYNTFKSRIIDYM
jgi:hypothetical protein